MLLRDYVPLWDNVKTFSSPPFKIFEKCSTSRPVSASKRGEGLLSSQFQTSENNA